MAMKIGGKYDPQDVCVRHWFRLSNDRKLLKKALEEQMHTLSKATLNAASVLRETLKERAISSPIFDKIINVIRDRSRRLNNPDRVLFSD